MRRISLFGLALLLSGCVATLAQVRQAPTTQVGNFSAPAPALSYCVLRGIEAIDSPYEAHLSGGPDQQEFFLTVTRQSLLAQRIVGFELHFVALAQLTKVELREGHRDGQALAQQGWSLIERCAQQLRSPSPSGPFPPGVAPN
ncbi:MAG: hypothetical protein ACREJN_16930 [Nitrospiraceae bacterium]